CASPIVSRMAANPQAARKSLVGKVRAVADWLIDGAPATPQLDQVIKKLCDDLCASGIPLWRMGLFLRTLHPDFFGRAFIWRRGAEVTSQTGAHSFRTSDDYLTS